MGLRYSPFLALVVLGACADSNGPSEDALQGAWLADLTAPGTIYTYTWCLRFGPGTVVIENREIGAPGRPSDGLMSLNRLIGTFRISADTLYSRMSSRTVFDFVPHRSAPIIQESTFEPSAGEDTQQIRLLGGRILRLTYYTYPADYPQRTTQDFVR